MNEITENDLLQKKQEIVKIRDFIIQAKATQVEIVKNLDVIIDGFTQLGTDKDSCDEKYEELDNELKSYVEKFNILIRDCKKILRENGML